MLLGKMSPLHRLARLYGVEVSYRDNKGSCRQAAPEALLAVLRALGAPVEGTTDIPEAIRGRVRELWQRCCEPVAVVWNGNPIQLTLRLPAGQKGDHVKGRLALENGQEIRWSCSTAQMPLLKSAAVDGVNYAARRLTLPGGLPPGYHRLTLELPSCRQEVFIISAPLRAYTGTGPTWGGFLPLYALQSRQSWGAGDLRDLDELLRWVRGLGGNFVGTLPLLAAYLEEPFAPSPYEPVSRLFWNEFYLNVAGVEELDGSPEARALLLAPEFQEEIAALRAGSLVDYRRGMALKRGVLEHCARACFAGASGRRDALERWLAEKPEARDYARFRAAVEQRRAGWQNWPDRLRDGDLREGDYNPEAERYHLYVQWRAHQQFRQLSGEAGGRGKGLYLDLPLGVHRDGYDVWRQRAAFALESSTGAPPDAFFDKGQNWGFPPLHPERIRERGYRYFIACLRHHLQHAGILRLDHVMGLHRLFWVPGGMSPRDGVYVHYRAEEFYAILALESRRHRTLLVGEDLGTVPYCVRAAMARHHIQRMYVLPFEMTSDRERPLRPEPVGALAGLNTHDMPPFAAFWLKEKKKAVYGLTLPLYLYRKGRLGVPTNKTAAVVRACLEHMAAGPAKVLQVNLEDLWLEKSPQNIPGTTEEFPNWRRKARYSLEQFSQKSEVLETLIDINRMRKAGEQLSLHRRSRSKPGRFCPGKVGMKR